MPTQEIQGGLEVKSDLSPYRGSWVALRDGEVVASALDPIELRENDAVHDEDWFVLVPNDLGGALLL